MGLVRGSLERGADVLALLAAADPPSDAAGIASHLHLPRSTVYRLLQVLRKRGLIVKTSPQGSLQLGLVFLRWAAVVRKRLGIIGLASGHLDALARLTGETANLHLLERDHAVPVDQRVTSARLRVVTEVGVALPLHAGAASKAILAYLPTTRWKEVLRHPLPRLTPKTIVDPRRLSRDLESARARGYAESDEEVLEGARGLAVPIFDEQGSVVGSLGIGGPRHRFHGEAVRRAVPPVLRAAAQLSASLGFQGPARREVRPERGVRVTRRAG
jgi:IclR family transcriptional regulator, acetate operon repressor